MNRKVSQTVAGTTTYNVWDGWNLIEERGSGNVLLNTYIYGAGEIIERIPGSTSYFCYQDHTGSTSHLADANGALLETYKYSTFGQQSVYNANGVIRKTGSAYDVRHLFTGQLWMPAAGLYDYRNRVFSPALTRFLQPDPIGFAGDPSNLYRYCGNNSVNSSDPLGLYPPAPTYISLNGITVFGNGVETANEASIGFRGPAGPLDFMGGLPGEGSPGGDGGPGGGSLLDLGPDDRFSLGPPLPVNPYSSPEPIPGDPPVPQPPTPTQPPAPTQPTPTHPPTPTQNPSRTPSLFDPRSPESPVNPGWGSIPFSDPGNPWGPGFYFPTPVPGGPLRPSPVPFPTTKPGSSFWF